MRYRIRETSSSGPDGNWTAKLWLIVSSTLSTDRQPAIRFQHGGPNQDGFVNLVFVPDELHDPPEHVHPVLYVIGRDYHGVCLGRLGIIPAQFAIDLMNN
jgi:hypothetical protein